MKKILFWILILMLLLPSSALAGKAEYEESFKGQSAQWQSYWRQKNERTFDLQRKIQTLPAKDRAAVLFNFQQREYADEKVFREKMHAEFMGNVKRELEQDKQLSDSQKNEILHFKESEYRWRVEFFEKRNQEDIDFFKKVISNPTMIPKQKKEASENLRAKQRKDLQNYRTTKESARKQFRLAMASLSSV